MLALFGHHDQPGLVQSRRRNVSRDQEQPLDDQAAVVTPVDVKRLDKTLKSTRKLEMRGKA